MPVSTGTKGRDCHNRLPFCIFSAVFFTQHFIHGVSYFMHYFYFPGLRCLDRQILLLQSPKVCDLGQAVQMGGLGAAASILEPRCAAGCSICIVRSVVFTQSQHIGPEVSLWSATHDCISDEIRLDCRSSPVPGRRDREVQDIRNNWGNKLQSANRSHLLLIFKGREGGG